MADSSSSAPDRSSTATLRAGSPKILIRGITAVAHPPEEAPRLEALSPIEREGARYGYGQAGRPFGPSREGLEIWLALRARAD
jgi:hypothetical protein